MDPPVKPVDDDLVYGDAVASLTPVTVGLDRVVQAFTMVQMLCEPSMCHAAILESDTKPVSGVANGG